MRELIAFTDGARRGNGDASAGVYFPNGCVDVAFDGNPTAGRVHSDGIYIGKRTNNEAEYEGLALAMQYAITHGYTKLIVFSDSKLMVNQMKGIFRVESEALRLLYEKAYTLACQLDFEINWIPREKNKEADAVCNQVLNQVQGMKN